MTTTTRERATGPCARCTRRTWAASRMCRRCTYRKEAEAIALTDGAWQLDPKRRIQVWVPAPSAPKAPEPLRERHCRCGAVLEKWKKLCQPCAVESRRASWRASRQRRRTAA